MTSLVIANWKMNLTPRESQALAAQLVAKLGKTPVAVAIAPSYPSLAPVRTALEGSPIQLAAQNVFWEDKGAYTGAVSPRDLQELGCRYGLVGHSERRHVFGEKNEETAKKCAALERQRMIPVLCVGETERERDRGETEAVIRVQVEQGLALIRPGADVVIAYEPVWAIGSGRTAKPADAQAVHAVIRQVLDRLGRTNAGIRILYGGSVTAENAHNLIEQPDISGFLVGGASLNAAEFTKIIEIAAKVRQ